MRGSMFNNSHGAPTQAGEDGLNGFSEQEYDTASDDPHDRHKTGHKTGGVRPKPLGQDTMQEAFDASIRPKLDAIDKVRHHLTGIDIELPAIVVVGDQSSGKSSVLESLSGIGLPRGGNLVTRCPLELALRRGQKESALLSYTDPNDGSKEISNSIQLVDIPDAVNAATRHLAGDNSGLVPALISLKVTKPEAPDLTLIDLPGIVRNPIGDQPEDIEQQIRDLIHKHIEGESKVILCVLPATADFATQEAIKISR
ncbi:TPA: Mx1p [Trebouxia sp. C0005]